MKTNYCIDCKYCKHLGIKGKTTKLYGCQFSKSPKYVFTRACLTRFKRREIEHVWFEAESEGE